MEIQCILPLQISPSDKGLMSGIPWHMTSLIDVQHDFGYL